MFKYGTSLTKLTSSGILGVDGEGAGLTSHAVAEAWTVGGHHAAVDSVHVELVRTACSSQSK